MYRDDRDLYDSFQDSKRNQCDLVFVVEQVSGRHPVWSGLAASHNPFGASCNMQYHLQASALEELPRMESSVLEVLFRAQNNSQNNVLRGISAACSKMHINPRMYHTASFPTGLLSQHNGYNNADPAISVPMSTPMKRSSF